MKCIKCSKDFSDISAIIVEGHRILELDESKYCFSCLFSEFFKRELEKNAFKEGKSPEQLAQEILKNYE
jgi:hypothetical protein